MAITDILINRFSSANSQIDGLWIWKQQGSSKVRILSTWEITAPDYSFIWFHLTLPLNSPSIQLYRRNGLWFTRRAPQQPRHHLFKRWWRIFKKKPRGVELCGNWDQLHIPPRQSVNDRSISDPITAYNSLLGVSRILVVNILYHLNKRCANLQPCTDVERFS